MCGSIQMEVTCQSLYQYKHIFSSLVGLIYWLAVVIGLIFICQVLRDSNSTGSLDDDLPRSLLDSTTSRELYGLFKWSAHESQQFWENDSVGQWLKCSCDSLFPQFSLNIRWETWCPIFEKLKEENVLFDLHRYLSKQFSVSELIGFNNTGNICNYCSQTENIWSAST